VVASPISGEVLLSHPGVLSHSMEEPAPDSAAAASAANSDRSACGTSLPPPPATAYHALSVLPLCTCWLSRPRCHVEAVEVLLACACTTAAVMMLG
jgi:hypothetical protein